MMPYAVGGSAHGLGQMLGEKIPQQLSGEGLLPCHHFPVGDFEDFRHIHLHQVVHGVFQAGKGHPVASHCYPLPSQLRRITVLHESAHERLVAREARIA